MVNSVNFEDGDHEGSRFSRIMPLVREHGAAVIALTIDEQGQARTRDHKVQVATRLIETLTTRWGMRVEDIIVDCLTFPIATGQEETRGDAVATIEAIREIKHRYPQVQTTLGVSNVSFGLAPAARVALNSASYTRPSAGLTRRSCTPPDPAGGADPGRATSGGPDLVHDRRRRHPTAPSLRPAPGVPRRLRRRTPPPRRPGHRTRGPAPDRAPAARRRRRERADGRPDLGTLRRTAHKVINDILLAGMRTVGELFGRGEMQLPFVLASAEVMKTAVAHLDPI